METVAAPIRRLSNFKERRAIRHGAPPPLTQSKTNPSAKQAFAGQSGRVPCMADGSLVLVIIASLREVLTAHNMVDTNTYAGISIQVAPTDEDQLPYAHIISEGQQLTKADRTPLNTDEKELLEKCIKDINAGLLELGTVAACLHIIKAKRLYRETHSSFEQFCEDTFHLSRSHAYRLVSEVEVKANFKHASPQNTATPKGTGQARVISGLTKERQLKVGQRVKSIVGDAPDTAKDWSQAKQDLILEGEIQAPAPSKIPTKAPKHAAPKVDTLKQALRIDANLVSLRALNQKAKRYDQLTGTNKTIVEKSTLWQEIKSGLQAWAVWEEQQLKEVA